MKIGSIKNGQRYIKFFQINQVTEEEKKNIKKMYEEFLEINYPEIKNLPLEVRSFTYEINEDRFCFTSTFKEEQELLEQFKVNLEEILK